MRRFLLVLAILPLAGAQPLRVEKGDHIVIVGNTFAERMQLFGWFESFLHARFPDHGLTVRNMGWSADEVGSRPRPLGFGTRHRYLAEERADVIIACFGMNESFAGKPGLERFRTGLAAWIRDLRSHRYNGRSPPRLVLISPIAHENPGGMLPDGTAHNANLEQYMNAMAEAAQSHGVPFVDLFRPTLERAGRPLTSNGIHLTRYGYWHVSQMMALSLGLIDSIPTPAAAAPVAAAEDLRRAVHDKNDTWMLLWRGPNMEYVHGRRNRLGGAKRMPAERTQLRGLLGQMDARIQRMPKPRPTDIWRSEPRGKPHWVTPPDYKGLEPSDIVLEKDEPGTILDPAAALKSFTLADGYAINLFASELDAPVYNPVAMCWDARGRLWVATSPTWPHPLPGQPPNDAVIVLEDVDGDGVADKHTVFMDGLDMVHGLALGDGGAYISQTPNLIFAVDTDGDLVADAFEVKLHGFGGEDVEHSINNYRWGPDGALYFMEGIFFHTQVETPLGPRRLLDGGLFRYKPSTARFDVFASYAFWNPWGQVFDTWGRQIVLDASSHDYFNASVLASPFVYPKHKRNRHDALSFAPGGLGPAAGIEIISSRHFPEQAQGRFIASQLSGGFRGTRWFDIEDRGTSYALTQVDPPLLVSRDPHFRPIAMNFGPDGALYLVDFYSPLIENTSDPKRARGRDHAHGRIWRIRHKSRPLHSQPAISGEPAPRLLELLKAAEDRTRKLVRRELHERGAAAVLLHLKTWIADLDHTVPEHERNLLEALWLHQAFEDVDTSLLSQLLAAKDPRARAAATRVLRFWQHRVDNSLSLLEKLVEDDDPKVRLQAVLACGFDGSPRAREVLLRVTRHDMDAGLRHALDDTMQALDRRGIDDRLPGFPAGDAYVLARVPSPRLVTLERTASVCREITTRPGLDPSLRRGALETLAEHRGSTFIAELLKTLETVRRQDDEGDEVSSDLVQLLMARPKKALRMAMPALRALATGAERGASRAAAYAAVIVARGAEDGWRFGERTDGLLHLLEGVRVIRDPAVRAGLAERITSLLAPETEPPLRRAAILALSSLAGGNDAAFATIAGLLRDRDEVNTAIASLARMPSAFWPRDRVPELASDVVAHVTGVVPDARRTPAFKRALRFANELVSLLEPTAAEAFQKTLDGLGVRSLTVRAVPHLMLFDKAHLVVEAGKPVEITFENPGVMAHNLVVVVPGALEEIGGRADAMVGDVAGDPARRFLPDSEKVLHSSGLVKPREAATLSFVAPEMVGDYPYLCTVPGHWVRMNGTLHVVEDVAQWVRENPDEAFGNNPLAQVQPRDWKLDDLVGDLSSLSGGRDRDRGKRLFVTHCGPCHRLEGTGSVVGSDLIEVSARLTPAEMLAEMLMPSNKIEDAYRSWIITCKDEEVVYGMIVERTDDWIRVVENPRLDKVGVKLRRDTIEEMRPSATSTMPMGVLNPLSRDQILDLLAYVRSVRKQ